MNVSITVAEAGTDVRENIRAARIRRTRASFGAFTTTNVRNNNCCIHTIIELLKIADGRKFSRRASAMLMHMGGEGGAGS